MSGHSIGFGEEIRILVLHTNKTASLGPEHSFQIFTFKIQMQSSLANFIAIFIKWWPLVKNYTVSQSFIEVRAMFARLGKFPNCSLEC